MLKVDQIQLYRQKSYEDFESAAGAKFELDCCKICDGVLQNCELYVNQIASEVLSSGFEFADFKISFTISISAYLKRFALISKAEQQLDSTFPGINKSTVKSNLDFNQIFKWIVSPLLAK